MTLFQLFCLQLLEYFVLLSYSTKLCYSSCLVSATAQSEWLRSRMIFSSPKSARHIFFIAKSKPLKVVTWLEITDFTSSFSSLYPQRFLHPLRHTGAQITLQSRPVQTVLHAVVQINKPQTARHNHPRFTPKEEGNNTATLNEYQSDGLKTLCVS